MSQEGNVAKLGFGNPDAYKPTDDMANMRSSSGGKSIFAEIGGTGIKQYSGFVNEEFLNKVQGQNGIRLYQEMTDNHPVIGGILFAIHSLIKQAEWRVEAASDAGKDQEAADFVSECLDDMDHSWDDFLSEALSMSSFGFSFHEQVFKRRDGPEYEGTPERYSRYDDGKIGWRRLPIRSQESLYKWEFDHNDTAIGFWQQPPTGGPTVYIPFEFGIHFKTVSRKGNPEGKSLIRNCVTSYLIQRSLQFIESVGVERDLAGLPVITCPAKILGRNASADEKATLGYLQTILRTIKRDENEGLIMPSDVDAKSGKPLYDIKLISAGGSRQMDADKIITRYDTRMAQSLMAQWIMLGAGGRTGSFALSSDQTELFATALKALMDMIASPFNRMAIPRIIKLNGFDPASTPHIVYSDIEKPDLQKLSQYISTLAGAGMPLFPDPALEERLRDLGDLPEPQEGSVRTAGDGTGEDNNDGGGGGPTEESSGEAGSQDASQANQ